MRYLDKISANQIFAVGGSFHAYLLIKFLNDIF